MWGTLRSLRLCGEKARLHGGFDDAAAEAGFAVVEDHRLSRRDRALRFGEFHDTGIRRPADDETGPVRLTVADPGGRAGAEPAIQCSLPVRRRRLNSAG